MELLDLGGLTVLISEVTFKNHLFSEQSQVYADQICQLNIVHHPYSLEERTKGESLLVLLTSTSGMMSFPKDGRS